LTSDGNCLRLVADTFPTAYRSFSTIEMTAITTPSRLRFIDIGEHGLFIGQIDFAYRQR
jgi:hypothetical protein